MKHLPHSLADHPSLIGIIRLPNCKIDTRITDIPVLVKKEDKYFQAMQQIDIAEYITSYKTDVTSNNINISKSKFTDFYPYTYYVLTDGETDPVIYKPQYMGSTAKIQAKYALSNQPIERYFVPGYRGDSDGRIYNITNINQMVLPTATNEGMAYLTANSNAIAQTRKNAVDGNVLNAVSSVGNVISNVASGNIAGAVGSTVSGVANGISGVNNIKAIDARNKDITLTPSSISSFGTPSTRDAFNNNQVRLLKYTIEDKYKNKVNNFVDRFGYKFNNYGTINHKSYKGYLKMISPDIDGKIDNMYINKIISILERGIYFE